MKLYCYGKEDITELANITKENWNNTLQQLIIGAVRNEEHLGKNLKQQCIDYLEKLFGDDEE